ncbi:GNAT family N-acetyltransferase [Desulfolutivibrio sp.]|uniref:GNAT family N-acetyltransferase n=1 Tax=Desulfolutivibrio sp. TaxID=2773296 RepID=UPI002F967FCB
MSENNITYKIANIKDHYELVGEVILLGDSQKKTLGFLPEQAFIDYAERGSIIIAISSKFKTIGYLLFAIKQNNICRLAHVCVAPEWRKHGVGNALISYLKKTTTHLNSIIVKCRRDYRIDHFWESNGFIAKSEINGRGSTPSTLTLFEYHHRLSLLSLKPESSKPLAVIDLNIVIDIASSSENESKALLSFTYSDEIDYRISEHSYTEANRNKDKDRRLQTRQQLDSIRHIKICNDPSIINSILSIIGKSNIDDAKQLASAIHNNAEYFITKDTGLTCHSESIQREFGIFVFTPTEFIINYCNLAGSDIYFPGYLSNSDVTFRPITQLKILDLFYEYKGANENKSSFLTYFRIKPSNAENFSMFKIIAHYSEIGMCVQLKSDNKLTIRVIRLKKSIKHMHTLSIHIIESILQSCMADGIEYVSVTDNACGRLVEQALGSAGFQIRNGFFTKPLGKGFLSTSDALKIACIHKDACFNTTSLIDLEHVLWPRKLDDLKIPVYIIPIKPAWASKLISSRWHQLSLFGKHYAMMQTRRAYYRSNKGINIKSPGRIIWYISTNNKSGPSKCAIGLSFINQVEIGTAKELYKKYERFGVYTWNDISKLSSNDSNTKLMVIEFSKTEIFDNMPTYNFLSSTINDYENRNFNPVSPFEICHSSFTKIYRTGIGHAK